MGVILSFCACAGNASPATNASPASAKRKWVDPAKARFVQRFDIFLKFSSSCVVSQNKPSCCTDRQVSRSNKPKQIRVLHTRWRSGSDGASPTFVFNSQIG